MTNNHQPQERRFAFAIAPYRPSDEAVKADWTGETPRAKFQGAKEHDISSVKGLSRDQGNAPSSCCSFGKRKRPSLVGLLKQA